jgi:hypothetical protein
VVELALFLLCANRFALRCRLSLASFPSEFDDDSDTWSMDALVGDCAADLSAMDVFSSLGKRKFSAANGSDIGVGSIEDVT